MKTAAERLAALMSRLPEEIREGAKRLRSEMFAGVQAPEELENAGVADEANADTPPSDSERGREPCLAEKRREWADEIRRISADARKFQKEVSPDVLRERFREHDEFFLLLEKAEQLVGNLDNSAQIQKEFLDWINEGGMSRLSEMWEKLRIARPAIKAAGQHRRLLRALSVLGVIFTAIAAAGAWAN